MADKAITALPAAATLTGAEVVHGVQGVNSRKLTTQAISNLYDPQLVIDEETGTSYTPVADDRRKWKEMNNASAITITLNTSVHVAGDELTFEQTGAGGLTFAAGTGFTLSSRDGLLSTVGRYSVVSIKIKSSTEGVLFGDLA